MAQPHFPHSDTFHPTVLHNFWKRVEVKGPDECWPWDGREAPAWGSKLSYPRFAWGLPDGRVQQHAHRFACTLKNGPPPGKEWALHSCDNPVCCNPNHLRWGTPAENAQDAIDRGRHASVTRGSKATQFQKTEACKNGHPWTPESTYWYTRNGARVRQCRVCHKNTETQRRNRLRQQ